MTGEDDDVVLKILHTADWHLGLRFSRFRREEDRIKLTRARLQVVERILDLAEQYQVDAVLCAGDLFDGPNPPSYPAELLKRFRDLKHWKRPIFLLPGNHDPLTDDSVYRPGSSFRQGLPSFVHVIDRDDFSYELSPEAILYAIPCRSSAGEDDLAMQLPGREPSDERIRIGMVHGSTFDMPEHQTSFPISKTAARERGLNYLAIGDTHAFRFVPEDETDVPTIYPSAPEATRFSEKDVGYVAVVLFRRGRAPRVKKERVAQWTWRQEHITDLNQLRALRLDPELAKTVLKLTFDLGLSIQEYDEAEAILAELEGSDASQGRAGPLQLDRSGLRQETIDLNDFPENLPPVIKSVVKRLSETDEVSQQVRERALFHLYREVTKKGGAPT